jgi:protein-S-isoprenylcysteine O-methyltransferase Ste14
MTAALSFTIFLLLWAAWWGSLHTRIRKNRAYTHGRASTSTDAAYRRLNPFLFAMQSSLCIASFWTSSRWLAPFHHSDAARVVGVLLFCGGSALYGWALRHLGSSYSPCYDAHAPAQLVRSGPYTTIRHPMYAGKLIIGVATVVLSGSLWFLPTTVYLFVATLRATYREDRALAVALPGSQTYRSQTTLLVPWLG